MRHWPIARLTSALLMLGLTPACGTEVTYGANQDKARELQRQAVAGGAEHSDDAVVGGLCPGGLAADGTCPSGAAGTNTPAPGTTGADPAGGASGTPTGGASLTCFGPAPVLPAGFDQFCALSDATLRGQFKASFDTICGQKRLANLLLTPCSWSGSDASAKYRRVLDKTPLDDQASKDFHFFAAYAVTTDDKFEDQVALVKKELEDPNYAQTYVTIKNSRVFDLTRNTDGTYDYTVEVANSSATVRFRAHVLFVPLTPDLTAVFDYAVSDKIIVKEHRFLRFISRLSPTQSRVIGIEEKILTDGGNHVLAYQNLTDVVKQREERDFENAHRD